MSRTPTAARQNGGSLNTSTYFQLNKYIKNGISFSQAASIWAQIFGTRGLAILTILVLYITSTLPFARIGPFAFTLSANQDLRFQAEYGNSSRNVEGNMPNPKWACGETPTIPEKNNFTDPPGAMEAGSTFHAE